MTASPATPTAYLFDVDGVLTNPQTKQVSPQIIQKLNAILSQGHLLTLNTGRSITWLIEPLLIPLLKNPEALSHLENVHIIGEKGCTWMEGSKITAHDQDPHQTPIEVDNTMQVPTKIQQEIRQLIDRKYAESMFYDETKQVMISTEMSDGFDLHMYEEQQQSLVQQLTQILESHNLLENFQIDATRIATDIQHKESGKALGAKRMLDLFEQQHIKPADYYYKCFGDSKSDVDMAIHLHSQHLPAEFIFVGGNNIFDETIIKDYDFPFTTTESLYDQGTLEYFAKRSGD